MSPPCLRAHLTAREKSKGPAGPRSGPPRAAVHDRTQPYTDTRARERARASDKYGRCAGGLLRCHESAHRLSRLWPVHTDTHTSTHTQLIARRCLGGARAAACGPRPRCGAPAFFGWGIARPGGLRCAALRCSPLAEAMGRTDGN